MFMVGITLQPYHGHKTLLLREQYLCFFSTIKRLTNKDFYIQITISKDDTVVLDGAGEKKAIEERCEQVGVFVDIMLQTFE